MAAAESGPEPENPKSTEKIVLDKKDDQTVDLQSDTGKQKNNADGQSESRFVDDVTMKQEEKVEVTSTCSSAQDISEIVKVKKEPPNVVEDKKATDPGINVRSETERKEVLDITKKIFLAFPIKNEPLKTENIDNTADVDEDSCENCETEVKLYISDENVLYHATEVQKNANNIDETSLHTHNGITYSISPVNDKPLCSLVFEYLKLTNEQPKGIFTINMSGGLVKTDQDEDVEVKHLKMEEGNSGKADSTTQNETPSATGQDEDISIKQEPMDTYNTKDNNGEEIEDGAGRRKLPSRRAKVAAASIIEKGKHGNLISTQTKPSLEKNRQALQNLFMRSPAVRTSVGITEGQNYLTRILERGARGRTRIKRRLLIDHKTDIPIANMKMNMQVTADTLCQTPQLAPSSKKNMKLCQLENVLHAPGKNILSEKLLKIFDSRLVTNPATDSDDELTDLQLTTLPDSVRFTTDVKNEPAERNTREGSTEDDKKWKTYYL